MFRDFKKYEIFDDGRVYSYHSKRFLKPKKQKNGYYSLHLTDNEGKSKYYLVHRVVVESIKGKIPEGMEINHLNEDKSDNRICNLSIVTPKQNINHGSRNERCSIKQINDPKKSKLVGKFNLNGELVEVFPSASEAGRHGYTQGNVSACCRGLIKTSQGFVWKYLFN